MRRWLTLGVALVVLLPSCRRDDPVVVPPVDVTPAPSPTAEPTPTEAASPTPTSTPTDDDLAGASCEEREGGSADTFPDFTRVRVEREDGAEKIEFRFEGNDDAAAPPMYYARFVDELTTDGEGAPVNVEGEAFLAISFMARGVDLSGEEFEEIYTGPKQLSPGLPTVKELRHLGDFEGLISWGVGLGSRACFVVRERPDRLTFLFPSG